MTIYALHGFLGRPKDWDGFTFNSKLKTVDLFDCNLFPHSDGLHNCAENFKIPEQNQKNILMGYSLGGRMALHLLKHNPQLWQGVILISTHPGLKNPKEKQKRIESDSQWAHRFKTEPWNQLMRDWNSQEVFKGHNKLSSEGDFGRKMLSDVLNYWSLGTQDDFSSTLQTIDIPILWITGAEDKSYSALADSLTFHHPLSRKWASPNSAHRVPWENPKEFQEQVNQFLFELNR